jgi:integrase
MLLNRAGLWLNEAIRLRVEDLDISRRRLTIREVEGDKDHISVLLECLMPARSH